MSKARDLANAGTALGAVSATELAYVDGVTSAIQTQIDGKQAINANVSTTELGYLDGVTSAIQTQIDSKIGSASAINPTIIDAKGDIITATAADTPARLAVGANGTVLTAASGQATGLEWATPVSGSMTSIASGSLSGASVSLTSIVGTYKDLKLLLIAPTATSNFEIDLQFNTLTTSIYHYSLNSNFSSSVINSTSNSRIRIMPDTLLSNGTNNFVLIDINDYASTSHFKTCNFNSGFSNNTPTKFVCTGVGGAEISAAITSIQLKPNAGTFNGGTYILYGVN